MNELDATLDSMSPEELRALEGEIDKKAADTTVAYYRALGAKAAREQFAEFKKTGKLTPALFLVKAAADNAQKVAEFSAALDRCSAEELAEIEAELDKRILDKVSAEIAAHYYQAGAKLAQTMWPAMKKEAARGPAAASFGKMFQAGVAGKKGTGFGHAIGTMFGKHPGLSLAGTAAAIPVAERVLGRRD